MASKLFYVHLFAHINEFCMHLRGRRIIHFLADTGRVERARIEIAIYQTLYGKLLFFK